MNTYDLITNRIIRQMELGQIPWRKPWHFLAPRNMVSGHKYSGINILLTTMSNYSSPYWLTFNQTVKLGGKVKKGAKATPIVFWKILKVEGKNADEDIDTKTI